jgi:hypothetical protein
MEIIMPISLHPGHRPIDAAALVLLRERQAVITAIDREAIEEVARNPTTARRLALLASELRREMAAEVAP